jgi:hypothetical protein
MGDPERVSRDHGLCAPVGAASSSRPMPRGPGIDRSGRTLHRHRAPSLTPSRDQVNTCSALRAERLAGEGDSTAGRAEVVGPHNVAGRTVTH